MRQELQNMMKRDVVAVRELGRGTVSTVFSTCCCGAASELPVEIDSMNLVSFSTRRVRMARTGIDNA